MAIDQYNQETGIKNVQPIDYDWVKNLFNDYVVPGASGVTEGLLDALQKFFATYLNDPRNLYSGLNVAGGSGGTYKVRVDSGDLEGYLGNKITGGDGITLTISGTTNKVISVEMDIAEVTGTAGDTSLLFDSKTLKKIGDSATVTVSETNGVITFESAGAGASSLLALDDVSPSSFSGQAGKSLTVASGETTTEFVEHLRTSGTTVNLDMNSKDIENVNGINIESIGVSANDQAVLTMTPTTGGTHGYIAHTGAGNSTPDSTYIGNNVSDGNVYIGDYNEQKILKVNATESNFKSPLKLDSTLDVFGEVDLHNQDIVNGGDVAGKKFLLNNDSGVTAFTLDYDDTQDYYAFTSRNDNGTYRDIPMSIDRSSAGNININRILDLNGNNIVNGGSASFAGSISTGVNSRSSHPASYKAVYQDASTGEYYTLS
ncbi:MAG: hypothetical protein GY928_37460 [Colwellia sp.]|nr:hypothetical protein [Colwellia sp.]